MSESQMERLKKRMFGPDGAGVTNVGIFPGFNRHATPEQVAGELNKVFDALESGDYEVVAEIGQ